MKLNEYLKLQMDRFAQEITTQAPIEACPRCCCNDCVQLNYDGNDFWYECAECNVRWSSDVIDVDKDGKFSVLEWAD